MKRLALIQSCRKNRVQSFDSRIADRYLGIDDRIDDQGGVLSDFGECALGPIPPARIVGGDIYQDVAVHEHATSSADRTARFTKLGSALAIPIELIDLKWVTIPLPSPRGFVGHGVGAGCPKTPEIAYVFIGGARISTFGK